MHLLRGVATSACGPLGELNDNHECVCIAGSVRGFYDHDGGLIVKCPCFSETDLNFELEWIFDQQRFGN